MNARTDQVLIGKLNSRAPQQRAEVEGFMDFVKVRRERDRDDAARRLGEAISSYAIPASAIYESVAGSEGAKVVAFWVRTPDEPFNVPIPKGSAKRAAVDRCTAPRAGRPPGTAKQFVPAI